MATTYDDLKKQYDAFSEAYNTLTTEMLKRDIPIDFLENVLDEGKQLMRTTFAPP